MLTGRRLVLWITGQICRIGLRTLHFGKPNDRSSSSYHPGHVPIPKSSLAYRMNNNWGGDPLVPNYGGDPIHVQEEMLQVTPPCHR